NGDATLLARTLYRSGDSWAGTLIEQFATSDGQRQESVGDDGVLSADLRMAAGVTVWTADLTVVWVGTPTPAVALHTPTSSLPPPFGSAGRGNLVALTNQ